MLSEGRTIGRPSLALAYASRFMIHSTAGLGTNRHLRNGPAITFR